MWPGPRSGAQEVLRLELGLGVAEAGKEPAVLQGHRMGGNPTASSAPATRAARPASIMTPRSPEIWTAGSSPNTFGRAKTAPAASTAAMRRCFQSG